MSGAERWASHGVNTLRASPREDVNPMLSDVSILSLGWLIGPSHEHHPYDNSTPLVPSMNPISLSRISANIESASEVMSHLRRNTKYVWTREQRRSSPRETGSSKIHQEEGKSYLWKQYPRHSEVPGNVFLPVARGTAP